MAIVPLRRFRLLDLIGDDTQGQRISIGSCLLLSSAVGLKPRNGGDFSDPAAIFILAQFQSRSSDPLAYSGGSL
jgi:hypothetical protein